MEWQSNLVDYTTLIPWLSLISTASQSLSNSGELHIVLSDVILIYQSFCYLHSEIYV